MTVYLLSTILSRSRPQRLLYLFVALFVSLAARSQAVVQVDTALVSHIRKEARERSSVMEVLTMLTDVNGPRLTNSPGFASAARYAQRTLESWGVGNVHFDYWGETFGRGWVLKEFTLATTAPGYSPLIAWPKAWSPSIKRTVDAEAVYLDISNVSDLDAFKGKLKGKIVLMSPPVPAGPSFKPDAWRHADSTLEEMASAKAAAAYQGRRPAPPSAEQRLAWQKWALCKEEGAAAVLEASARLENDGTLVTGSATVPYPPETPYGNRAQPWHDNSPEILPQVVVAAEHYNRIIRQLQSGVVVKLRLTLHAEFTPSAEGFNVIGEIPGTDLSDEVVMIGAHLDSWHSATGATDNAAGVAVMMEAMRIIKTLDVPPRRTIRIALWGGEEQGLLGSLSYVKRKLGQRLDRRYPYDSIRLTDAGRKFSVYFNMDYGAGKYRGVYLQGNEAALPLFRGWVKPFEIDGAGTLSLRNATGTDHLSFDALGLPAFQFIQDPLEYATRTHHANMDVYDKVVADDLMHNAAMTAYLAWMAANADSLVPRDESR